MEVQEDFYHNQALPFKTPSKKKGTIYENRLELVTAVPYSPLFKDDEQIILGDLWEVSSGLMSQFNQSIATMTGSLVAFLKDYREQSDLASVAISSLWLCLMMMEGLVGSRPSVLPNEYQAPSAWGSIGQLVIKIDRANRLSVLASAVEKILAGLETKLKIH
jgi:hypothetical protein